MKLISLTRNIDTEQMLQTSNSVVVNQLMFLVFVAGQRIIEIIEIRVFFPFLFCRNLLGVKYRNTMEDVEIYPDHS